MTLQIMLEIVCEIIYKEFTATLPMGSLKTIVERQPHSTIYPEVRFERETSFEF